MDERPDSPDDAAAPAVPRAGRSYGSGIQLSYEIPAMPMDECREGSNAAAWAYGCNLFYIPFFLVPLIRRNNRFALFHAKQAAVIWAGYFVVIPLVMVLGEYVRPADFLQREILEFGGGLLICAWYSLNVFGLFRASKLSLKSVPIAGWIAGRLLSRIDVRAIR